MRLGEPCCSTDVCQRRRCVGDCSAAAPLTSPEGCRELQCSRQSYHSLPCDVSDHPGTRDYDRPDLLILSSEKKNARICRRKARAHQLRRDSRRRFRCSSVKGCMRDNLQNYFAFNFVDIPVIFQLHHKHSVYVNHSAISWRLLTQ